MDEPTSEVVRRWQEAGLLTRAQADAIRLFEASRARARRQERMPALDPPPPPRRSPYLPLGADRRDQRQPPSARPRFPGWAGPAPGTGPRWLVLTLGLLAALGVVGAAIGVVADVFGAPLRVFTVHLEESVHLAASVIGLVGAVWMYQGRPGGRGLVLASLGVNLAVTVLLGYRKLLDPASVLALAVWLLLAAAVLFSRRLPRTRFD